MTGERIKELRRKKGWKQSELAKRLNISASAVGMYENNRRIPTKETLLKLCDLFDVTADYLLYGNDAKNQEKTTDLSEEFDALREKLIRQEGLMFHGKPVSAEDIDKIFRAVKIGAEVAFSEEEGRY